MSSKTCMSRRLHLIRPLASCKTSSCLSSTYSGFEFWVLVFEFWALRFLDLGASFSRFGCVVFEIWVLRASVSVFECFVFEATQPNSG